MMKITVVTVCLNAEKHIRRCCESVRLQRWPDLEHLVVDGGSTDGTLALVKAASIPDVRIYSGPDAGIYDAMNKAIGLSTGDAILFLNADDWFAHEDALGALARKLQTEERLGLVYGDAIVIDGDRAVIKGQAHLDEGSIGCEMVCHQTILASRSAFEQVGGFDTQYRLCADLDWLMRAIDAGVGYGHVPNAVCFYSAGGESDKAQSRRKAEKQAILVRRRNPARRWGQRLRAALRRRLKTRFSFY
ncbi:glycosyltransferase family 2 protein [Roseateles violae]|uniref:Glycosyltransferase family 2 protein n=1 Tax=Roseateles violae TaxID=3058042 RepID=A0ABT8DRP6_9BURK|nr:glycosyltransferase family 2 protein [Pelomonas sp. PFR6]MDN3920857.1 glycosyltransferase family 2 protein [Pelomonas sp. PFR6]